MPRFSFLACVQKCIRVPFHHTNQGVFAACCSRMNLSARSEVSSSTVSMPWRVSGPVSSMRWVPSGIVHEWMTPRGPNLSQTVLPSGSFKAVG